MKQIKLHYETLVKKDYDSLSNFVLAKIKKLTTLESEEIPFVITTMDSHTGDYLLLNVQWAGYDAPHTRALQMMYRKEEPAIMDIVGSKENYLGFIDAAEMLVAHFIQLYFSI